MPLELNVLRLGGIARKKSLGLKVWASRCSDLRGSDIVVVDIPGALQERGESWSLD